MDDYFSTSTPCLKWSNMQPIFLLTPLLWFVFPSINIMLPLPDSSNRNPGPRSPTMIHHLLLLLLLSFFILVLSSLGADTISGNQTLSGNQTIVSSGQNFELGFFALGNPSRYYIGIWYKKITFDNIVWVANRETPVFDNNNSSLRILDGNLVLLNGSQSRSQIVWSTGLNSSTSSVVARLRDDGNLVLLDSSNLNSTQPLWESFNNVADTWLPGGRISFNKKTQKSQLLISWKNSEDPAPGLFSLELDPVQSQYIIRWNRSQEYWSSGPWNNRTFSGVPEMNLNYIYDFSYFNGADESYFTYSVKDPSNISKFTMAISGQIKQQSWMFNSSWMMFWSKPTWQCDVHAYCGAFSSCNQNSQPFCSCLRGFTPKTINDWNLSDYSGGCVREVNLQCDGRDRFFTMNYVSLPNNTERLTAGSIGECESVCLSNCSCTAYAYDATGSACSVWYGGMLNLRQLSEGDGGGRDIYIRLSASSSVFSGDGKDNKGVIIGVIVGSLVALLVMIIVFWRIGLFGRSSKVVEGSLVAFSYRDLQNATKSFADKLGGGGFGSVFKGTLPDSTVIAVKKLESISQGEKQFRTEVSTIGTIQHVNLVRLRGFCSQGNRKLLVYEYMENGSLDSHLFNADDDKSRVLNWKTRYEIALGVARGLSYLHEKCRDCIIHCDIKPENILLDSELCPKVADFGLAKLIGHEFSRVLTTMRGTRGYLAPEWISGIAITTKADVYSYGMMVFELVSGRRNTENCEDGKISFFPCLAARVMLDGSDLLSLLDPRLDRSADVEEVLKICRTACWCIQDDEKMRPSMGEVVQILEGLMDVNLPPVPRSLQVLLQRMGEEEEHIVFFTDSSRCEASSND